MIKCKGEKLPDLFTELQDALDRWWNTSPTDLSEAELHDIDRVIDKYKAHRRFMKARRDKAGRKFPSFN